MQRSDEGVAWKLSHDLYYLKRRSLRFDLFVLFASVWESVAGSQFREPRLTPVVVGEAHEPVIRPRGCSGADARPGAGARSQSSSVKSSPSFDGGTLRPVISARLAVVCLGVLAATMSCWFRAWRPRLRRAPPLHPLRGGVAKCLRPEGPLQPRSSIRGRWPTAAGGLQATSPFNQPIPSGARVAPNSSQVVAKLMSFDPSTTSSSARPTLQMTTHIPCISPGPAIRCSGCTAPRAGVAARSKASGFGFPTRRAPLRATTGI